MEYHQINVGDRAELSHEITASDIEKFVSLSGDDNRLHVDQQYAANTAFKKPVAHGMISASFISTIIGTRIPGDGALWYEQNLEFLLPVRVGDIITVKAEVIKKIDRLKAIELKTEIYNQHRQKVINGTAKVKVIPKKVEEQTGPKRETGLRNVLIIGSSGGIGSTVAHALNNKNHQLILHFFQNKKKAEDLKKSLLKDDYPQPLTVQADMNDETEIDQMLRYIQSRIGPVHKIVYAPTSKVFNLPLRELQWGDIQNHLNVHVKGLFLLMKKVLPDMESHRYGKIVAITTQAIEYPFADLSSYITAKAALNGLVKSMAYDLAPKGIQLNMVSPGITDTELNADLPEKAKLLAASKTPLRRLASPEDVAGAIAFLLSDQSGFLSGETIRVNGGQTMI